MEWETQLDEFVTQLGFTDGPATAPEPNRCRICGVPLPFRTLCPECAKEEIVDLDFAYDTAAFDFDEYAAQVDRIVEEAGLRAFWD